LKIAIVTVYNSLNYGSFWQAFAMREVLRVRKADVSFVQTNARKPFRQTIQSLLGHIRTLHFERAWFQVLKYFSFRRGVKDFSICRYANRSLIDQDVFVFGSDEIWNISRKDFSNFPIFFGVGIPEAYLVSYAVSINSTTLEQITANEVFKKALERFDHLSVRDAYTLETLKAVTDKMISLVMDPTLLLGKNWYDHLEEKCPDKDYILIYSYGHNMEQDKIDGILTFAREKNMKLVSVGFYLKWCDNNIPASPFLFLSYIKNASFIITDTFHGTVFSIIYEKEFVTYAGSKRKIQELLNQFDLLSRNGDGCAALGEIFSGHIDYDRVNILIDTFRNDSFKYIDDWIINSKRKSR
jgi:hypothetical protein